jgi:hypothetical protein
MLLAGLFVYLCKTEYVFEGVTHSGYCEDGEGAWAWLETIMRKAYLCVPRPITSQRSLTLHDIVVVRRGIHSVIVDVLVNWALEVTSSSQGRSYRELSFQSTGIALCQNTKILRSKHPADYRHRECIHVVGAEVKHMLVM